MQKIDDIIEFMVIHTRLPIEEIRSLTDNERIKYLRAIKQQKDSE